MSQSCCAHSKSLPSQRDFKKIVILGSPNVGKSVLFNNFTGHYVTVANYPGTTVEVSRGKTKIVGAKFEIMDTPGIYSLTPLSEEERVARRILLDENPAVVLHIVDAKNLERMLPLTFQLIETGVPVILVLNMMDEAAKWGVQINCEALASQLGVPVIGTVSTTKKGMTELKKAILQLTGLPKLVERMRIIYDGTIGDFLEQAVRNMEILFSASYPISKRSLSLFLLKEDEEISKLVREKQPSDFAKILEIVKEAKTRSQGPVEFAVAVSLQQQASCLAQRTIKINQKPLEVKNQGGLIREFLNRLTINPFTGFPILFLVLYFGLYRFVGVFGGGTVVNFLEGTVFEKYFNPFVIRLFSLLIPWAILRDLFVGEYGILTQGLRYALALILPIVTFYFTVFAIIEDIGYLPRLAMLMDRTFKKIGLSGRAVIPMVLGFGCDTMATMVTRTLPTIRERIISTLLLSLAIPCSAQLGVILALLSKRPLALSIWVGVVTLVFLWIGLLSAQILPGERPSFYMELPPLRWPKIGNVFVKTYLRVKWYIVEVLPLFILASILIWAGKLTGFFDFLIRLLTYPVNLIGLPREAAAMFLFGFFRRDYGAAGLYDLTKRGLLNGVQILVACVALTLFLPCIAQFLMNVKERGWKTGLTISAVTLLFSFGVAYILNLVLLKFGVSL